MLTTNPETLKIIDKFPDVIAYADEQQKVGFEAIFTDGHFNGTIRTCLNLGADEEHWRPLSQNENPALYALIEKKAAHDYPITPDSF